MDFCLKGNESEARSSQTATRPLAVLWFESLLLVWRLHSRTIRPVARFLFSFKGSVNSPQMLALALGF